MPATAPKLFESPPAEIHENTWYMFRPGVLVCLSAGSVDVRFEGLRKGGNGGDHVACFPTEEAEGLIGFLRKFATEAKKNQAKRPSPPSPPPAPSPSPPAARAAPPPAPTPAPVPPPASGGSIFD